MPRTIIKCSGRSLVDVDERVGGRSTRPGLAARLKKTAGLPDTGQGSDCQQANKAKEREARACQSGLRVLSHQRKTALRESFGKFAAPVCKMLEV
jgi:hypothetical protein